MKIGKTIFCDYQSTTPVDPRVIQRMLPYWGERFGNPHSSDHILGWEADKAVRQSLEIIGKAIGADAEEIILTSGATEANNLAILGLAKGIAASRPRQIVSCRTEHKAVLGPIHWLQEHEGWQATWLHAEKDGSISLDELRDTLMQGASIVSLMGVNNEIGTIHPLREISLLCRESGALFHCDASQALCAFDLRDIASDIDAISISSHKIYGPKGIGALYLKHDLHNTIEPLFYGGDQQEGIRPGTVPVPLAVGLAEAIEIMASPDAITEREKTETLRNIFVEKVLGSGRNTKLNGPAPSTRHPGNANLCFPRYSNHEILQCLQPRIAASTGSACSSGTIEPSYVLRETGLSVEDANSSIRFSFGRFTSMDQIEETVEILLEVLQDLAR